MVRNTPQGQAEYGMPDDPPQNFCPEHPVQLYVLLMKLGLHAPTHLLQLTDLLQLTADGHVAPVLLMKLGLHASTTLAQLKQLTDMGCCGGCQSISLCAKLEPAKGSRVAVEEQPPHSKVGTEADACSSTILSGATLSSQGLAGEGSALAEEQSRFDKLNRENVKMRRILDRVRDLVEEAWARGDRARVVVESLPRRAPPLAIDALPTTSGPMEDKPQEASDGMEGTGNWVRIKNSISMDTCPSANIMPTAWLPQFAMGSRTMPSASLQLCQLPGTSSHVMQHTFVHDEPLQSLQVVSQMAKCAPPKQLTDMGCCGGYQSISLCAKLEPAKGSRVAVLQNQIKEKTMEEVLKVTEDLLAEWSGDSIIKTIHDSVFAFWQQRARQYEMTSSNFGVERERYLWSYPPRRVTKYAPWAPMSRRHIKKWNKSQNKL